MRQASVPRFGAVLLVVLCGGCAFGDRKVDPNYRPVMTIKARSPQSVDVRAFSSTRGLENESQIGQVRNTYGMVTAKVYSNGGDASKWVQQALADELSNAGFTLASAPNPAAGGVVINGAMSEFMTDISMGGYKTRIRVKLTVLRGGVARLDKEFGVEDGGSGVSASGSEYQDAANAALTKLMRRAVPDVIAAIEG